MNLFDEVIVLFMAGGWQLIAMSLASGAMSGLVIWLLLRFPRRVDNSTTTINVRSDADTASFADQVAVLERSLKRSLADGTANPILVPGEQLAGLLVPLPSLIPDSPAPDGWVVVLLPTALSNRPASYLRSDGWYTDPDRASVFDSSRAAVSGYYNYRTVDYTGGPGQVRGSMVLCLGPDDHVDVLLYDRFSEAR